MSETCWSLGCKNPPEGTVRGTGPGAAEKDVCDDHGQDYVENGGWTEFIPFESDGTPRYVATDTSQ